MVPLKKYGKQGPYSSLLTPKRAYLFNFSEKSFIDVPTSGHVGTLRRDIAPGRPCSVLQNNFKALKISQQTLLINSSNLFLGF
jgi:hypothetical protein